MRLLQSIFVSLLMGVCVCAQSVSAPNGLPGPDHLLITLNPASIIPTGTSSLSAAVINTDGSQSSTAGSFCSWSSSNTGIATVAGPYPPPTNVATGVSAGTATISCTLPTTLCTGAVPCTGSATLTVSSVPLLTNPPLVGASPYPLNTGFGPPSALAYSFTFAATGGTPPYTWSCPATCTLPAWATLSSAGIMTGTPNATGTTTFNVEATDSLSNSNTWAVSITVVPNASSGFYPNSTQSQLANNLVAGCMTGVPSALCGSANSSTYSFAASGEVFTINVANHFGTGAVGQISGCSSAPFNGLIFTTNGSTTTSAVVGTLQNVDGTAYTHANISSTADTTCYLQGQGWQPFVTAPFPAPGNSACTLGNGQPGCTAPGTSASGINTWAFDWDTPSGALNSVPKNCIVQLTDQSFDAGKSYVPSLSGETNDGLISLNDGSGGYFFGLVNGGATRILHGHYSATGCNGQPGFFTDTLTRANSWIQTPINYGRFSLATTPGTNQAKWYDINLSNNYAPTYESRILSNAAGVVTSATPVTLFNVNLCPGWNYATIGTGFLPTAQFGVNNSDADVYFGLGTGGQGSATQHTAFHLHITNFTGTSGNTCENWDTEGYTGTTATSIVSNPVSAGSGTGYQVGDTLSFSEGANCIGSVNVASIGTSGQAKTFTINSFSVGNCTLNASVSPTGGHGTGAVLSIAGIGAPGTPCVPSQSWTCGTVWPVGSTAPTVTPWAAFGIHSGNMEKSGASGYFSGWGKTAQAAGACSVSGRCDYIVWSLGTTTFTSQTDPNLGGHPAIGCGFLGDAYNPFYARGQYPNLTSSTEILTNGITPTQQSHSTWEDPSCNQTPPFLLTNSMNTSCSTSTNPPNFSGPFGQALFAVAQSSTLTVPQTWTFARWYENTCNKTENFEALDGIWTCAPDGKFCIGPSDQNSGFSGNAGMGLDNTLATPFTPAFSYVFQ